MAQREAGGIKVKNSLFVIFSPFFPKSKGSEGPNKNNGLKVFTFPTLSMFPAAVTKSDVLGSPIFFFFFFFFYLHAGKTQRNWLDHFFFFFLNEEGVRVRKKTAIRWFLI
jgi:hypothetical protein